MNERTSKEVLRQWVTAIQEDSCGLTDWEEDFVESVSEQLEQRGSLSPRQEELLEKIYSEKTP